MSSELKGKRVAILVADGFEQVEMSEPRKALDQAGARTEIVSPVQGEVQGWSHQEKGRRFRVETDLGSADAGDYDALLLPGGVMNPDQLRTICHGPWLLAEADVIRGRRMTSWPSIKTDLRNAGAKWVDEPVVSDNGLITSRKPDDIPAFNRKMIEEFRDGARVPREQGDCEHEANIGS